MSAEAHAQHVIVFLGPTMPADEARDIIDVDYRPPVAQGDLYRAALENPVAIAVIDGRFGSVPAVWHKEILWALSHRIHVLGSSSMGALRAAELDVYGMEGFGEVYRWYREGIIDADDEVAVAHAPPEDDYRSVSDPLVNIRAAVRRAVDDRVIDRSDAESYVEHARRLFYPERSWAALLAQRPNPRFASWLRTERIDQKRDDAELLLRELRDRLDAGIAPLDADLRVEQSQVWARARAVAGGARGAEDLPFDVLADELRLRPATPAASAYAEVYKEALLRHLMFDAADRLGLATEDDQATLRRVDAHFFDDALRRLPERAADRDDYADLVSNARRKAALLAAGSGAPPDPADLGVSADELVTSFFDARGLAPPTRPEAIDRFARSAGFADVEAFRRALTLDHLLIAGQARQPSRNGDPI